MRRDGVDGRLLRENAVAFLPKGKAYSARVATPEGSRVLRIALPGGRPEAPAYDGRVWTGRLTEAGVPDVGAE